MLPDALWTIDEVAEYLAVSDKTVRRYMRDRALPHIKIGNTLRFERADIMAWVEDQKVEPRRTITVRRHGMSATVNIGAVKTK